MTASEALPESLYLNLSGHVNALLNSLARDSKDPALVSAQGQAREKLNAIKAALTLSINDLQRNAEHKTFTIAFYGETNAGKSTLIETLRILFKESSKLAQRKQFIALQQKLGVSEEVLQALETEIASLNQQHQQVLHEISEVTVQHEEIEKKQILQEATLAAQIEQHKADASFLQRISNFLRKLPEEIALQKLQAERAALPSQCETELEPLHQRNEVLQDQLATERQHYATALNGLHLLADYEDGSIIGDGRPDFTRQTQTYEFAINGQTFNLLDVPGIEGDESTVSEQINNAVKRAHAVFYVTAKAAPPQTGDASHQGTLEKIKAQLGDQTEIWTLYNKRITNPLALRKPKLLSNDEQAGLDDLDRIMAERLGSHYQRSLTLCALPAFYAVATCVVPRSTAAASRKKFLEALDSEALLEKTGVQQFYRFLTQNLVTDVRAKIRCSNLNKVKQAFNHVCSGVKLLQTETFAPLAAQLDKEAQSAKHQLVIAFNALNSRLRNTGEQSIGNFEEAVRERIYNCISNDIDNDQFKSELEQTLKEENATLQCQLPAALERQIVHFQTDVSEIVERFEAHATELLKGYAQVTKTKMADEFDLKIDIDSGINIWGVLGSLAAAVAMIWNPVAWPLMLLGAVGIVVSLTKALWSFFDSDYKKSQQRKAADDNLKTFCDTIRNGFSKTLNQALPPLQRNIEEIEYALDQPAVQASHINQKLDVAYLGLMKLARELTV